MKPFAVQPLGDHVLVKRDQVESVTPGGIILPNMGGKDKPEKGTIVAVGPGRINEHTNSLIAMNTSDGQRVLLHKYCGIEVKIDGDDYLMCKESELIGVLNES